MMFCFLIPGANAQTRLDYANDLMQDNDYFRAISVYKEILFFSEDAETRNHCLLQISKAYWKSNKFKASIKFLTRLLNSTDDSQYYNSGMIYLGLNYYGLKTYQMAADYFKRVSRSDSSGFADLYLALVETEKGAYQQASQLFKEIHDSSPNSEIGAISKELADISLKGKNLKRKSPLVAGLFSVILPGSGQFYCRHYYDGLQAMLYVGAFALTTYAAHRYDKKFNDHYTSTYLAASITGMFHVGNVIGAYRTAQYYNFKQHQHFLKEVRFKVFSIEF